MAKPPPTYDLMLLLDAQLEEDARAKIVSDAQALIGRGGEVQGDAQDFGRRSLAYEVRKRPDATYHLVQFTATPETLAELNRTLRITDGVVRFRIIKLAPGTPPAPDLRQPVASAAPTAEAGEPVPAGPVERL